MGRIDESIEKMHEFINVIKTKSFEHGTELSDDDKLQIKAIADKTINTINSSISKLVEMKQQVGDDSQLEDFLSRLDKKCEDVTAYTIMKIEEIKPIIKDTVIDLKEDLEKTFSEFNTVTEEKTTSDDSVFINIKNDFEEDTKEVKDTVEQTVQENIEEVKEDVQENVEELKENIKANIDDVKGEFNDSIEKILENENVKNIIKFISDTKDKAIEIYNMPETQEVINRAKLKIIDIAEKGLDTLKVILEKDDTVKEEKKDENL